MTTDRKPDPRIDRNDDEIERIATYHRSKAPNTCATLFDGSVPVGWCITHSRSIWDCKAEQDKRVAADQQRIEQLESELAEMTSAYNVRNDEVTGLSGMLEEARASLEQALAERERLQAAINNPDSFLSEILQRKKVAERELIQLMQREKPLISIPIQKTDTDQIMMAVFEDVDWMLKLIARLQDEAQAVRDERDELEEDKNFFEGTGAAAFDVLADALGLKSGGLLSTAIEAAKEINHLRATLPLVAKTALEIAAIIADRHDENDPYCGEDCTGRTATHIRSIKPDDVVLDVVQLDAQADASEK